MIVIGKKHLERAKKNVNDEYYTLYEDVKEELDYFIDKLENKIIYCNCDDPRISNFWKYFIDNAEKIKYKKVISTYINNNNEECVYKTEYENGKITKTKLTGNGSFDSEECLALLDECDVVVTNPPFSLWRKYTDEIHKRNKDMILVGNINAITKCMNTERLLKGNVHMRVKRMYFMKDGTDKTFISTAWYSTFYDPRHKTSFELTKTYDPEKYPKYDNYDAINCDKIKDIPYDYKGKIGVPITILEYMNENKFIVCDVLKSKNCSIGGGQRQCYTRIIIEFKD